MDPSDPSPLKPIPCDPGVFCLGGVFKTTTIPWIPIVGNHEYYDGDKLSRYLNQTEGTVVANPGESNGPQRDD